MEVMAIKGHGSSNDIFVVPHSVYDIFHSVQEARRVARALCARDGAFGADGVYYADIDGRPLDATFVNADGSVAEFCGNGMRLLARLAFDRQGIDTIEFRIGHLDYVASMRPDGRHGVRSVAIQMPVVDFAAPGEVSPGMPAGPTRVTALETKLEFTAVRVPNPHLIALVDEFDEAELLRVGRTANTRRDYFPHGANVSFALPLPNGELFVRTYERGSGLTLSCGSGAVAATCVALREGALASMDGVVVRNVGGPMHCRVLRLSDNEWIPELEGNATLVYTTHVDLEQLRVISPSDRISFELDFHADEVMAFADLFNAHRAILIEQGIPVASLTE